MRLLRCSDGLVLACGEEVTYGELATVADDAGRDVRLVHFRVPLTFKNVSISFGWYANPPRDPTSDECRALYAHPMILATRTPDNLSWPERLRVVLIQAAQTLEDDELTQFVDTPLATHVPAIVAPMGEPCMVCGAACEALQTRLCDACRAKAWDTAVEQVEARSTRPA